MSVRWASGAMLAILAGSVAADECGQFRLALALEDAAEQALTAVIDDATKAGIEWWKTDRYDPLQAAVKETTDRTEEAALAVRRALDDGIDRRDG